MLCAFCLPSGPTAFQSIRSRTKCRDYSKRGISDCSDLAVPKPKSAPQPGQGGMMDLTDMIKGMTPHMVNNPMGMMMMMMGDMMAACRAPRSRRLVAPR